MVARCVALGLASLGASTCYEIEQSSHVTTISYRHDIVLWSAVAAAVILSVGIALARHKKLRRFGVVLAGLAVIEGGLAVPSMWRDRVTVSPLGVHQTTGAWFSPTEKGFQFADITSVKIHAVDDGRHTNRHWLVRYRDGRLEDIDPGDVWEDNEAVVVDRVSAAGVKVEIGG